MFPKLKKILFQIVRCTVIFIFYINLSLSLDSDDEKYSQRLKVFKDITYITTEHLTPEIKLYLTPISYDLRFHWSTYYPGEQALARYILDNDNVVRNKTVLEIGCGGAAAAIAAVMSGAKEVTANDINPNSIMVAKLNAELNDVRLNYSYENLAYANLPHDVIILSEVFSNDKLFYWLMKLEGNGKTVLLGDRGRVEWLGNYAFDPYWEKLAEYKISHYRPVFLTIVDDETNLTVMDEEYGGVFTFPLPYLDLLTFYINLWLTYCKKDEDSQYSKIIKHYTRVTVRHLTPEIRLYLHCPEKTGPLPFEIYKQLPTFPYWTRYSPAEQALARYIIDNNNIVKNKSVLEIGCGCGAASIAAAMSNAREITANDIDLFAITASKLNAKLNNVHLRYIHQDLTGLNDIQQEVIILSDVYPVAPGYKWNPNFFDWLEKLKENGKTVLLGDYDRKQWLNTTYAKSKSYVKLATYELPFYTTEQEEYINEFGIFTVKQGGVYTFVS